jgi:lysophospholipase L1-like esterase
VSVACAAVLLGAVGCQTGVWAGDGEISVAVIGDSLTYQAEGNRNLTDPRRLLADDLVASGYRSYVTGIVGATVGDGHTFWWPGAADPALDVLVIALGTNDVVREYPLEVSRAQLSGWLEDLDDLGCVALVGVDESAWGWGLDVRGPAFNQMLQEEAAAAPNAIYVPWVPQVESDDGEVHLLSDEAKAEYRAALHGAADACVATMAPADVHAGGPGR